MCSGGFDLTSGHGAGVGFVTLPALKTLIALRDASAEGSNVQRRLQRTLVLARNTTSLKYRYAYLSIFQSLIKLC